MNAQQHAAMAAAHAAFSTERAAMMTEVASKAAREAASDTQERRMRMPEPVAWMHTHHQKGQKEASLHRVLQCDMDQGWQHHPLFAHYQLNALVQSMHSKAVQICQKWIDDHSKADNCTYNDCDMVAAVTDVMNQIKGMMK